MFTMNNKKQPPEVFYKKAVLKNFSILTGKYLCSSLFLIKLRPFISVTFLKRDFNAGVAKFLKTLILNKICKQLLLNNVKRNYSSMKILKQVLTFAGKYLYRSVLFNKYSCRMQLRPIFIKKVVPKVVFSWQSSEILTTFLKRKKALLWEKKHCYKKRGSDTYRKSNSATFYVTSPRFLYFSKS